MREVCAACGKPMGAGFVDPLLQPAPSVETVDTKPAAQKQSASQDILSLARGRLAQLEIEIAALDTKRREAEMLRRMIAAAEPLN